MTKVGIHEWQLEDKEWEDFILLSGYEAITLLHFVNKSADTYYVTGYNAKGFEVGGYETLSSQGKVARCTDVVSQNHEEYPLLPGGEMVIFQQVETCNVYQIRKSSMLPHMLRDICNHSNL
ncbi:hypothetical protein Tco_1229617 [Tanacetum coccineum]